MFFVVIAASVLDVFRQAVGNLVRVLAVFFDNVGHMVADHGREPACSIDAFIHRAGKGRGSGHDLEIRHVAAGGLAGGDGVVGQAFEDSRIGDLQNHTVPVFTGVV